MNFAMVFKKYRIITVVNSILAVLVMTAFLLLMRDIISISATAPKKPQPQNPVLQGRDIPKKELMDYNTILKKNPFGFYAGELKQLSGISNQQSASQLDITLVGTVSGHKQFAYAIFADKNNAQEVFKIGDSVFGLGKLQKIEKEMVVINDKGKTKEIRITDIVSVKESALSDTKGNIPSRPRATRAIRRAEQSSPDSFSGEKFARKMADTSYIVDGQRVQQALSNPNQIMTDARLLPNVTDGRQEGFVLKEVRQNGIYQSLGLQNGDILLRINEYNISNPEAALQAFTALKGMDRVQLDIIRNGARMTMTYQIR